MDIQAGARQCPDMRGVEACALQRFIDAQKSAYPQAVTELHAGRKRSHWMWFVFPQLRGLGQSANARTYGIRDLAEARAYLAHPVLGVRLAYATQAMLLHDRMGASRVLGTLDALKLRSCLTLFSLAAGQPSLFSVALERLFGGQLDEQTQALLLAQGELDTTGR